jgi:hypothetical protein
MWESALSISKGCGKGGENSFLFFHAFHSPSFPRPASITPDSQAAIFIVASVQSCSNCIGLT